jgi:hypothetical protein
MNASGTVLVLTFVQRRRSGLVQHGELFVVLLQQQSPLLQLLLLLLKLHQLLLWTGTAVMV